MVDICPYTVILLFGVAVIFVLFCQFFVYMYFCCFCVVFVFLCCLRNWQFVLISLQTINTHWLNWIIFLPRPLQRFVYHCTLYQSNCKSFHQFYWRLRTLWTVCRWMLFEMPFYRLGSFSLLRRSEAQQQLLTVSSGVSCTMCHCSYWLLVLVSTVPYSTAVADC